MALDFKEVTSNNSSAQMANGTEENTKGMDQEAFNLLKMVLKPITVGNTSIAKMTILGRYATSAYRPLVPQKGEYILKYIFGELNQLTVKNAKNLYSILTTVNEATVNSWVVDEDSIIKVCMSVPYPAEIEFLGESDVGDRNSLLGLLEAQIQLKDDQKAANVNAKLARSQRLAESAAKSLMKVYVTNKLIKLDGTTECFNALSKIITPIYLGYGLSKSEADTLAINVRNGIVIL